MLHDLAAIELLVPANQWDVKKKVFNDKLFKRFDSKKHKNTVCGVFI